jgi:hypothetical protein
MNNWRSIAQSAIVLLSVALLLLPGEARADEFKLSIVGLKYDPSERVAGFDFKISGGQVAGFPQIPSGWRITIDNDPSWSSEISGTAIVGATFLPPQDLTNSTIMIRVIPRELKKYPAEPFECRITGYIDLYKRDEVRRINLTVANFVISTP